MQSRLQYTFNTIIPYLSCCCLILFLSNLDANKKTHNLLISERGTGAIWFLSQCLETLFIKAFDYVMDMMNDDLIYVY